MVAALVLAGCAGQDGDDTGADTQAESESGSSEDDGATSSDSGDEAATETETETETDTDATPPADDLFACGLSSDCEEIVMHIDPEPATALECAGQIVTSGVPGLIYAVDTPGPDIDETAYFVFALGDGTAIVQQRERHCDADCPFEAAGPQRLCAVEVAPAIVEACTCEGDMCGECSWDPFFGLGECTEIAEPYDCTAIASFLEG
jgi:hypothetical protein